MDYANFTLELQELFIELLPIYIGKAHQQAGTKVKHKADRTLVTDLDNHTLSCLRDLINHHFPDDYTIGEEDGESREQMRAALDNQDQCQWTIDGLDGTWHFVAGTNSYGAAISRRLGQKILYAAIFRPVDFALRHNGFIVAQEGEGTKEWCGDCGEYHALHTLAPGQSKRLTVHLEGSSKRFFLSPISELGREITTRASLSSCIAATTVARGMANGVVTSGNKPWDNWPIIGIVEGAGGVVTDFEGHPRDLANCEDIVAAANATESEQIIAALQES